MTAQPSIPRSPAGAILRPGVNCGRVADTAHAAVLIDGEAYYSRLHEALRRACRSILIVGWDFDASISLRPADPEPQSLGDFLRALVEDNEALEIRILIWSVAVIHAPGAPLPLVLGESWQDHPRITLRLDREHPLYGSHHQKIVCIDDAIAFSGGMDLTVRRWDSSRHLPDDECRLAPDGSSYGPVHDVQMVVDAEAAHAVARVAKDRWRIATGEQAPNCRRAGPAWPACWSADFRDVRVSLSRTAPALHGRPELREVEALTVDSLAAARRHVYIEAQYLTSPMVRRLLEEKLRQPDGPEVVAVLTRESRGRVERLFMGNNRDRLLRALRRVAGPERFMAYWPHNCDADGPCPIHVHAKVLIVDDAFLRIGSANLNNRSMGLDTELDLGIEAGTAEQRRDIRRVRAMLLADHLGADWETVERQVELSGSIIRAIEALIGGERGLRPFEIDARGPVSQIPGTAIFDPGCSLGSLWVRLRRRLSARLALPQQVARLEGEQ